MGFQPFDLEWWATHGCREKLEETLTPLCNAKEINVKKVVEQYDAMQPRAHHIIEEGCKPIDLVWGEVMRGAKSARRMHEEIGVLVSVMQCSLRGTGELESNFSALQAMHSHRQAGASVKHVRNRLKIVLDGPKPQEIFPFKKEACPIYLSTPLAVRSQNAYFVLFGGKEFRSTATTRSKRSFAFKKGARPGSAPHILATREGQVQSAMVKNEACADEQQVAVVQQAAVDAQKERWCKDQEKMEVAFIKKQEKKCHRLHDDALPRGENPARAEKLKEWKKQHE